MTPAVRILLSEKIKFEPCFYNYEERGGTAVSSRELGVSEHEVIKTLIMQDETKKPMIVLMHGDREVSTKQLARELGVKTITPCDPVTADRHSGYQVGGTSPFGTRKQMPVYMQKTIADLETIYINGGKRGFLVKIASADVVRLLKPMLLEIVA
jgi:Cys-tRNA(Pro) deacylase